MEWALNIETDAKKRITSHDWFGCDYSVANRQSGMDASVLPRHTGKWVVVVSTSQGINENPPSGRKVRECRIEKDEANKFRLEKHGISPEQRISSWTPTLKL